MTHFPLLLFYAIASRRVTDAAMVCTASMKRVSEGFPTDRATVSTDQVLLRTMFKLETSVSCFIFLASVAHFSPWGIGYAVLFPFSLPFFLNCNLGAVLHFLLAIMILLSVFLSLCLINLVMPIAASGIHFQDRYLEQDWLYTIAQEHCGDLLSTYATQGSRCTSVSNKSDGMGRRNDTATMPSGRACDQAYHVSNCILTHLANWPGLSSYDLDEWWPILFSPWSYRPLSSDFCCITKGLQLSCYLQHPQLQIYYRPMSTENQLQYSSERQRSLWKRQIQRHWLKILG